MPSPSRRRALQPGRIDGLKVRVVDDPAAGAVDVGHALRLLARMMVRSHQAGGDHGAMDDNTHAGSNLTVVRNIAPHHGTDEAA